MGLLKPLKCFKDAWECFFVHLGFSLQYRGGSLKHYCNY